MSDDNQAKAAAASMRNLLRIFTVPEGPDSTLGKIDHEITENLADFLRDRIVATEEDLTLIEEDFNDAEIPEEPTFVSDYTEFLMDAVVARSVHTAAPGFVGHMQTAMPYFILPLSRIMTALNQNLVKIETSKAFTPMERQVLGMLHRLVYEEGDAFYADWMHNPEAALGAFCSGGTVANITALWVARNQLFAPKEGFKGIAASGLHRALKAYGYDDVAIPVSRRGHYSLGKAIDLLGIGRDNLVTIPSDAKNRIKLDELRKTCERLRDQGTRVMAIVGVAGTTETGSVDPLDELADIAQEFDCHFHVDAAWGGPTLFSKKYRHLLKGIERADSVTIDAHKQLYVPMGAGMVLFKNPASVASIEHHAEYILRRGSKDLGSHTLEGSRPGVAMLVHAALKIIARRGYSLLIDQGIEKARLFADMIEAHPEFELITEPELNLLTYRYVPSWLQAVMATADSATRVEINTVLDEVISRVQKIQRAAGKTFVSRTRLTAPTYADQKVTVFRVVMANPLTEKSNLEEVLSEQVSIANTDQETLEMLASLDKYKTAGSHQACG